MNTPPVRIVRSDFYSARVFPYLHGATSLRRAWKMSTLYRTEPAYRMYLREVMRDDALAAVREARAEARMTARAA